MVESGTQFLEHSIPFGESRTEPITVFLTMEMSTYCRALSWEATDFHFSE